jgi:Helix-turn-helix domain
VVESWPARFVSDGVPLQTFWQAGCEGMIGVWSGGEAMGRPPTIPEKKIRIVSAILAGEISIAEAARKGRVSEQSIGRWKAKFIEAGRTALVAGRSGPSSREG